MNPLPFPPLPPPIEPDALIDGADKIVLTMLENGIDPPEALN